MKSWGPLLPQLLLSFLPQGPGAQAQPGDCFQVGPCKCLLRGSRQEINLAAVGALTVPLAPDDESGGYVQFSPCQPFSEPANLPSTDCVQVAACVSLRQAGTGNLHHTAYGRHQRSQCRYNNSTRVLTVTYPARPSSSLNTLAHFNCSPVRTVAYVSLLPTQLEVFIQNPCACPDHCLLWSPGPSSLLAISFLVTLGIYLLWGICGLPAVPSQRGSQLIPPDRFWCSPCSSCLGKPEDDKENIPLRGLCSGT
ncbi:uncharacterized protein LOC127550836 [Antechinus flavipes]|uniref:uncharacterized protein LOC127550836 n=1 Tax=Antechinus flavipes TaxID=38775 RepID=UPI0022356855|nr:uncharacterized protein LOC127550836 [Antechinus flavipes]XP_051836030.1 uncharacterized protein LOC127550836 [Antechinus flavipes]